MYKEALEKFQKEHTDYKVIFLHKSGSYLYGTQTPNSDIDYRGIFIPSKIDVLLKKDSGQWNCSTTNESEKNKAGDLDLTLWSVYKFFGMLQGGDTNAFDTLFAVNSPSVEFCLPEMQLIYDNREHFLPNSLKSFFGYALTQVRKYSVKGDRLKDVGTVLEFLNGTITPLDKLTLSMVQHSLPYSEKLKWVIDQDGIEYYEVIGKKYVKNMKLSEFKERVLEIQNSFGARARAAMDSGSVDYKAMYHAFRVLDECLELMATKEIKFPLERKEQYIQIRNRQIAPEALFQALEERFDFVSEFEKSDKNLLRDSKFDVKKSHEILLNFLRNS
jgi:hypothetical protein